jgi:hypothetical protein
MNPVVAALCGAVALDMINRRWRAGLDKSAACRNEAGNGACSAATIILA